MSPIRFTAKLGTIGSTTVLLLPKTASAKFPSRGMVMAKGTMNGEKFIFPLEPDGKASHWLNVTKEMTQKTGLGAGDEAMLEMEPIKDWPEPVIPADVKKAFKEAPNMIELWEECTPAAHWDWLRWIQSTKNADTRAKRIEVAFSKLRAGERRPCCFNRSACCDPDVSKGGVLLEVV